MKGCSKQSLVALVCWIIRQFWFNPFEPLGDNAIGLNLIFGIVFSVLTYTLVGFVHNGNPSDGSITYMFLYAINTAATYLFCSVYPSKTLMLIIVIGYIAIIIITLKWIAERN